MITVKIRNQELDLYKNTQIQYVLNNPVFVGGDIDKFNGTYTLPFSIPLTARNRAILNYPERLNNNSVLLTDVPCVISFDRKPLFSGLASLKKPTWSRKVKSAKLYVVQDSYKSLKNNSLRDLDLGAFTFDSQFQTLGHARGTAVDHLRYSHAFFPVRNPKMTEEFEILGAPHDLSLIHI